MTKYCKLAPVINTLRRVVMNRHYRLSQIGMFALFSLMYAGRLAQSSGSAGSFTFHPQSEGGKQRV